MKLGKGFKFMTISEKFKEIRKHKNITQTEFGGKLGVTKQSIANIECGKNNPSIELISKLICNFNVNANWLIAGIGEPFLENKEENQKLEVIVEKILKKHGLI